MTLNDAWYTLRGCMLNIISQMIEPTPQALHYSWLMHFAAVFQLWVPNKTSLQGHWLTISAITFVILCSLFSPDRIQPTAHQEPTPQPAAVASNSISSRIKHAPPSPVLWKTSLQGWVWEDIFFISDNTLCSARCLVLNLLLPVIVCCNVPCHSSTLDRERAVIALFWLCVSLL